MRHCDGMSWVWPQIPVRNPLSTVQTLPCKVLHKFITHFLTLIMGLDNYGTDSVSHGTLSGEEGPVDDNGRADTGRLHEAMVTDHNGSHSGLADSPTQQPSDTAVDLVNYPVFHKLHP